VWGSDVFDFPDQSPLAGRLVRWNLRRATRVAATSRMMARQVRALVPRIADVAITPFGVDGERFRPIDGMRDAAAVTIGTVKTLDDKYGIDLLVRAFARLVADPVLVAAGAASRLRLTIVGNGPRRAELEDLARELRVDGVTTFVGQVPHAEVPSWLNRLDIYAAPSRLDSESFGVAVIEASSCAVPVVVSDAGGLPEVVEDRVTGFVVRRESVDTLTGALRVLVLSESQRHAMGAAGRTFVQREFAWSACVDHMLDLYESVIDGAPAR
jgi:glycosyltransferase involved in cell wall biosynthesis